MGAINVIQDPLDAINKESFHKEALELLLVCVQDIVDAWPKTTIRTLGEMTKRIDTLRQALEAVQAKKPVEEKEIFWIEETRMGTTGSL